MPRTNYSDKPFEIVLEEIAGHIEITPPDLDAIIAANLKYIRLPKVDPDALQNIIWKQYKIDASSSDELQKFYEDYEKTLLSNGFSADTTTNILLGAEEAIQNAQEHAYNMTAGKTVEVNIYIFPTRAMTSVLSDGPPIDLFQIKRSLNQHPFSNNKRGRGIYMMAKLSDLVFFNTYKDPSGTNPLDVIILSAKNSTVN